MDRTGMRSENLSLPPGATLRDGSSSNIGSSLRGWRWPVLLPIVVLCLTMDIVALAAGAWADFRAYRDVGYPDSSTILRISEYIHSGHLYSDIHHPPYYPTLYGPVGYVLMSIPYRLAMHFSYPPERALRLAVFACFLGSVVLVFLISRRLHASISTALLAALFALSGTELRIWIMQIRFDFLALLFALLGIWLCLGEKRWQLGLAAICGGLALLSKQTFAAMPIAVCLWFLCRRRFFTAFCWGAAVTVTVVAGYGFFVLREPLAWQNFAALSHPLFAWPKLYLALAAVREAKILFFLFGAYFAWRHRDSPSLAIILYFGVTLCIAVSTELQIGADTNYFEELWAAAAILAAPGLIELSRRLYRAPAAVPLLVGILLLNFFAPKVYRDLVNCRDSYLEMRGYAARRSQWEQFHAVLAGRRLLAFAPDLALWSRTPELPDFVLSCALESAGKWDSSPIVHDIQTTSYDAILGVDSAPWGEGDLPSVLQAIRQHYVRTCEFQEVSVWLPDHGAPDLLAHLMDVGCQLEK